MNLAKQIFDSSYLQGEFVLRSGKIANHYFDKFRFQSFPDILSSVAESLSLILPKDADFVGGVALGAIPLVTALSLKTGKRAVFIRKERKGYGPDNLVEGAEVAGKKVVVIEDVITTGGAVFAAIDELRKEGAVVTDTLCVVNRGENEGALARQKFQEIGVTLHHLFIEENLLQYK